MSSIVSVRTAMKTKILNAILLFVLIVVGIFIYYHYRIAQYVHNPAYHFRNGDATFFVEGTELFSSTCGESDEVLVGQDAG